MTIAFLATGDEIVHGDTLNTNTQAMAHVLSSEGHPLGLHIACSDKEKDIVDCLNFLAQQHDVIIITGGLGPTTDDRTRFALGRFLNEPLIEFTDAVHHIETRLSRGKIALNAGNMQQALFPAQAKLLPNPNGSAMGCSGLWHKTQYFMLPGPPRECLPMFHDFVLPELTQLNRSSKQLIKWQLFGVAESEIAAVLEHALADLDCQTGYRLDVPYIEFKVKCRPEMIRTVKDRVDPLVKAHLISQGDLKASAFLRQVILEKGVSTTILDEATGGQLEILLKHPGDQGLILFHHNSTAKIEFHIQGLSEYWQQLPSDGKATLKLSYKHGHLQHSQSQSIPYRSQYVVHYAAEWLCYRMAQIIQQL